MPVTYGRMVTIIEEIQRIAAGEAVSNETLAQYVLHLMKLSDQHAAQINHLKRRVETADGSFTFSDGEIIQGFPLHGERAFGKQHDTWEFRGYKDHGKLVVIAQGSEANMRRLSSNHKTYQIGKVEVYQLVNPEEREPHLKPTAHEEKSSDPFTRLDWNRFFEKETPNQKKREA